MSGPTISHVHYGLSNLQADVALVDDHGHHITKIRITLRRRPITRRWYAPQTSAATRGLVHTYTWRDLPDWLRPTVTELVDLWAHHDPTRRPASLGLAARWLLLWSAGIGAFAGVIAAVVTRP